MSASKYRPRRTALERVMGTLNILPKFVLRLPFETPMSWRLILLSYTGRKSGREYTIPVSYVEEDNTLLVPSGGTWKNNLKNGLAVRIRLRGREQSAIPQVITDLDTVDQLATYMMAANPAVSRFIGVPKGPHGHPEPDLLEAAIRGGFAVVRLRLGPDRLNARLE